MRLGGGVTLDLNLDCDPGDPENRSPAIVVGILNVTPDSFSDGGRWTDAEAAIAAGVAMAAAGAGIVDVGGESTRPDAVVVAPDEELARVLPVIEGLVARGVVVSVDTTKATVAAAAIEAGAHLVNDISGGRFDPDIIEVTAASAAGFVLGHVSGDNLAAVHAAMTAPPSAETVEAELVARVAALPRSLVGRTICDPGLGFGKPTALNLRLTQNSGALARALQCPVMVGPSRKRFLGELTGKPAIDRDDATTGAALAAVACGAQLVRVHDVGKTVDALSVFEAVMNAPGGNR